MGNLGSNAISRIKADDVSTLLEYILKLLNSIDLELRLIALKSLEDLNQRYDVINNINNSLLLNLLSDDSLDIRLYSLRFLSTVDLSSLEITTKNKIIKTIIDIYKYNNSFQLHLPSEIYLTPKFFHVSIEDDVLLTEMLEKGIKQIPANVFEFRDELESLLKIYLKGDISFGRFYLDSQGALYDIQEAKRFAVIFKCLNRLVDRVQQSRYKGELLDAMEKGNSIEQARATVLLATSFGSNDEIINKIVHKLHSPLYEVRSFSVFALYFLELDDSKINFIRSLYCKSSDRSSRLLTHLRQLILGKGCLGLEAKELVWTSFFANSDFNPYRLDNKKNEVSDFQRNQAIINSIYLKVIFGEMLINFNEKYIEFFIGSLDIDTPRDDYTLDNYIYIFNKLNEKERAKLILNLAKSQQASKYLHILKKADIPIGKSSDEFKSIMGMLELDDYNIVNSALDLLTLKKLI